MSVAVKALIGLLLAPLVAHAQVSAPAVEPTLISAVFINQIVLVLVAATLTFVAARYWYTRRAVDEKIAAAENDKKELQERVTSLEKQLASMATEVQPISDAFRAILIKQLTHFHTPVLDALMEKIGPPCLLSDEEEKQLHVELKNREKDMGPLIDDSERNAAQLLPLMIERMRIETPKEEAVELKIVSIPPVVGGESPTPEKAPAVEDEQKKPQEDPAVARP